MILSFLGVAREVNASSFPEIPVPCTRVERMSSGVYEIEFAADLTARQQWFVRIRVSSQDPVTEQLMQDYFDSLGDLRAVRNTSGTLTTAQLSNAVRALATAQIRAARLLFGDISYSAE